MFNSNGGYSLSDIAAVTGQNGNGFGWGNGDGAWWIIILFLFVFCGWGNNGNAGFGGGSAALTRGELCQDMNFSDLEAGVRGIQQGLCDGFYAMNTGMLNGFAGIQNNLSSEFRAVDNAICNLGYNTQAGFNTMNLANVQNTNNITTQLNNMAAQNAACCCDIQRQVERGFADTNYNMATQDCQTRQVISNSTRDIIDNQNASTRAILDFLTQDKISTLQAENQSLKFQASQTAQNAYLTANQSAQTAELIRRLGADCPVPAYIVPNPNCCYNGCNYNYSGCGCC